jgi:hypothetical protein
MYPPPEESRPSMGRRTRTSLPSEPQVSTLMQPLFVQAMGMYELYTRNIVHLRLEARKHHRLTAWPSRDCRLWDIHDTRSARGPDQTVRGMQLLRLRWDVPVHAHLPLKGALYVCGRHVVVRGYHLRDVYEQGAPTSWVTHCLGYLFPFLRFMNGFSAIVLGRGQHRKERGLAYEYSCESAR